MPVRNSLGSAGANEPIAKSTLDGFGSSTVGELVRKGQLRRTLDLHDLQALIIGVFAAPLLAPRQYAAIQGFVRRLREFDDHCKSLADDFLALDYEWFVHRKLMWEMSMMHMSTEVPYKVDHIPKNTVHNRRPGLKLVPKYLTIHSVGVPNTHATGERHNLGQTSNVRDASFHIVVDDKQAIECLPLNEVAWHATDGANGPGNRGSLALEMCESGNRAVTLHNAISVAAKTLKAHELGADKLRRHRDWFNKECPRILIDPKLRTDKGQTWEWFKAQVGKELAPKSTAMAMPKLRG